jgi:hypothetical protein
VLIQPARWERFGLKPWIEAAVKRLQRMKLVVAPAHKLARIAWGVLTSGRNFEVLQPGQVGVDLAGAPD